MRRYVALGSSMAAGPGIRPRAVDYLTLLPPPGTAAP